jgi:LysR family transcriptional regulator (chromosome initiation inhibitor)
MGNLDYRGLAVLDAIAACGSFEKAALALGISQSAVSQRIKALEDAAGRLLVVRGVPSMPTGLGQRLVVHHRQVKVMEAALDIDLGRQVSLPDIAVALDADSLSTWFGAALPALLAPPRCQLDLQLADTEQALRLVREGAVFGSVSGAPQGLAELGGGTSSTPLGLMRYVCVATKGFAAHWFGDGFSLEAARLAPAAVSPSNFLAVYLGQQLGLRGSFPHHVMPSAASVQTCIAGGLAYGLLPELSALSLLNTDRLVDLHPGHTHDVDLYWHAWNIDTPYTRTLSEHIVDTARRHLLQA